MRFILSAALALGLAGCEGFVGMPHGYVGKINVETFVGPSFEIDAVPSIVPDGGEPMGFRNGFIEDAYSYLRTSELTAVGMPAIAESCDAKADCIEALLRQGSITMAISTWLRS